MPKNNVKESALSTIINNLRRIICILMVLSSLVVIIPDNEGLIVYTTNNELRQDTGYSFVKDALDVIYDDDSVVSIGQISYIANLSNNEEDYSVVVKIKYNNGEKDKARFFVTDYFLKRSPLAIGGPGTWEIQHRETSENNYSTQKKATISTFLKLVDKAIECREYRYDSNAILAFQEEYVR